MDRLSEVFGALADPTRRAILARLTEGEATVNQLAEPFPISLQAISKHLKVLERAGLITRGKAAQWRPCRLDAGPLREVADWIVDYRRFWEQRYDGLDDYLRELQRDGTQKTGTQTTGTQTTGTQKAGTQKAGTQEVGTQQEE